jgi:PAS domain S-box-containing protein
MGKDNKSEAAKLRQNEEGTLGNNKEERSSELIIINKELTFQITERKQAEEALRESKAKYQAIFESTGTATFISDENAIILMANNECYSITGYTPTEIIGQKWNQYFASESLQEIMKNHKLRRQNPDLASKKYEVKLVNKKGEKRDVILSVGMIPGTKQSIVSVSDITERKQAELELILANKELTFQKEEKGKRAAEYKDIYDNAIEGMFRTSLKGKSLQSNKALAKMLGYDTADNFVNSVTDSGHQVWANADERLKYAEILEEQDIIQKYECQYKRVDGEIIWVSLNSRLVRDKNGKALYYEGFVEDITERKQAEEEIRKLNFELEDRVVMRTAQLEASNKELEAFSYSVSHDLRAPLRHVSGYVELLNKRFQSELPEKGQHYLNSIADSVRIMGMLIDNLLQFSRTGRTEMHQSDLDMNEIVKEVKESLCKDNPDRKIEWVLGKLPSVNGDEAMLKLVWTNLLGNAVKFTRTRKKARIEIGVRKEKKEQVFFVRDNGVGFDMQYAHKLFGVFQRLHPTEEFEGTGIGLANVHRIILRHGGRTWAEAEIDKGAVFNFSIPNK